MKTILVTGSRGYIASHFIFELKEKYSNDFFVIGIDDFSNSDENNFNLNKEDLFFNFNLKNEKKLEEVFKKNKIDAVIHFAGSISVSESVIYPDKYYENNFEVTKNLLMLMDKYNIHNIIFSSTAAVYGDKYNEQITEAFSTNPINPYGKSKLLSENEIINSNIKKYVILRYFNVAGNNGVNGYGYAPKTEISHLVPSIINSFKNNLSIKIFGNDYKTKDGTAVRDYVHVVDLANAHILSLEKMLSENEFKKIYNISSEKPTTVLEMCNEAMEFFKNDIKIEFCNRRAGDPEILFASSEKIRKELLWKTKFGIKDLFYN